MARSEYWSCPLRLPTPAAAHVAIASGVSQRVTSPRRTRARSYSAQFPTRYVVVYFGCTLGLHIVIMTRRRSRWSTCRPLLAHRAESAHQRRGTGAKHPYGDRRGESVHPRMGWLLSPGHSDRPVRQTGSMDSPAPPQNPVGAMEETADSVSQNGRTGTRGCACAQGHRHRARRPVERGGLAHACGREQSLACGVGTPEPSDSTPGSAAEHLNRRVRNRTHGGVGGREG